MKINKMGELKKGELYLVQLTTDTIAKKAVIAPSLLTLDAVLTYNEKEIDFIEKVRVISRYTKHGYETKK